MDRRRSKKRRFTSFRDEPLDLYEEDLDEEDYDDEESFDESVITRKYESKNIGFRIDKTKEESERNWAQSLSELEHDKYDSLESTYAIISKYK